ncbi:MAG: thermonuclease family protein [Alphaproteobacteria bacterium]
MKWILTFLWCISSVFIAPAPVYAGDFPAGDFSELKKTASARVLSVIDPETIQLDDKSIIRLSGIEYPDFDLRDPGEFSLAALKILKDMLEGKTVNIYQTKKEDAGRLNRMGHKIAQIERQSDNAWVEGSMIILGLARTRTSAANPQMAQQMLILEEIARAEKSGIWTKDKFKILTAEKAGDQIGSAGIVQGKIQSAAIKNNRVYLNFGPDWRNDFTVSIAPENKRAFSKRKIDLLQMTQKTVRVRGFIQEYNGPVIEIDHPEALEIMQK